MRPILTPNLKKEKTFGIFYTTKHNGKMAGIYSLSTSAKTNPFCIARAKQGDSICSQCFAVRQMKYYKSMNDCYTRNAKILCEKIIPDEYIPIITVSKFRFEAFGDLQNETQLANYFNIARLNPECKFALWTKNIGIVRKGIEKYKKPNNLTIVYSSKNINEVSNINFDFVDKVFTVFTPEYVSEHGVSINCGAKSCAMCGRCYRKTGGIEYVNELLK